MNRSAGVRADPRGAEARSADPRPDLVRRTGLSVSTVRYYADAGVVTPAATTAAGHRLYDVSAIARLELVRTLRELDAGLDEIRQVLTGKSTLRALATTHLALLTRQEAMDAAREQVPPDSPQGRDIADRRIGWLSGIFAEAPDTRLCVRCSERPLLGLEVA